MARMTSVAPKSAAYRMNMPSWSGMRHRCDCTVFDASPESGAPVLETGFHRLSMTMPGWRTPIAQESDFTVISLMPPPPEVYAWCRTSQ